MTINTSSYQKRKCLLQIRKDFLTTKSTVFLGQSLERRKYLQQLETLQPNLSTFQMSYLVGLVASDASVECQHSKQIARIKIQQSVKHLAWLQWVRDEIFQEYSPNDSPLVNPSIDRKDTVEWQTFTCSTFYKAIVPLFYPNNVKTITPEIEEWINPVSVAAWFCGDGSSRDKKEKPDKGLILHTECFTETECNLLIKMLERKLGFQTSQTFKGELSISGKSYDRFVELVGPYIHPDFFKRVPEGRSPKSRFGTITVEKRAAFLGSKLVDMNFLIHDYKP